MSSPDSDSSSSPLLPSGALSHRHGSRSSRYSDRHQEEEEEKEEEKEEDEEGPSAPPEASRSLTLDDVLNFVGFGWFQVVAFFLAGFAYLAYGMDVSVLIFITKAVEKEWNITNVQYAVLPSVTSVPNIIGAFVFGFLGDTFGRILPLAVALVLCGMFSIATAFAPTFPALVGIRSISSLGIGAVNTLTYPMILEFLPVKNRAKVTIMIILLPAVGLCASTGLAWWLFTAYPVHGWRYYLIASGIPSLFAAGFRVLFYFQSPRFLIAKGKAVAAWKILSVMARVNGKDLTTFIDRAEFCDTFSQEDKPKHREYTVLSFSRTFLSLFRNFLTIFSRKYLRRTLCLVVLIVTQSFGFLGSTLFLPTVLAHLGENFYFSVLVSFIASIPGVLFMAIIVEWPCVGRLNALRLFSTLTIVFFLLFAFIRTPVTSSVFLVFLYFCMAPIFALLYTYIGESYPTSIRNVTSAFFYIIQAISGILYPYVSGYLATLPQPWIYPVVWACVFAVQLVAALALNYEPYSRTLIDTIQS